MPPIQEPARADAKRDISREHAFADAEMVRAIAVGAAVVGLLIVAMVNRNAFVESSAATAAGKLIDGYGYSSRPGVQVH